MSANALVTGGTAGVGLSMVRALVSAGSFVHFIGTSEAKGKRIEAELNRGARPTCRFIQLDLSSLRGVRDFALEFKRASDTLDVLANVAGVILPERQETSEGLEKTLVVDHLAAYVLAKELAPLVANAQHGRILNVSGAPRYMMKAGIDFEDFEVRNKYSFIRSAINAVHAKTVITQVLAEELPDIDVNAFHPGAVKSDLVRHTKLHVRAVVGVARLFMSSESKSGIYVATSPELRGTTGHYFVGTKGQPLAFAKDYRERVRDATEALIARVLG